jgi:phage terminase large subunit GpA-like protein
LNMCGKHDMGRERELIHGLADTVFRGSPTEPVWAWAERNVWLSEKMVSQPKYYDSRLTPWTRAWQEVVADYETREAIFMKSSQSGVTEASLNIVRWMPEHRPGNVLYATTSRDEGRKVCKNRLLPTLTSAALSENPDEVTGNLIGCKNMDIVVSGSGASGPFLQAWYRVIILDELENHQQDQGTTTYDRALSRMATVADGKLFAMSKPEISGGLIHWHYLRGSQEKWLVPCPRCGERIELVWDHVTFGEARDLVGAWDMRLLPQVTHYRCQACGGRIEEHEKTAMVRAGGWVATQPERRDRGPDGRAVPAEPGVRSFHISDLYSCWENVSWANLARIFLSSFVVSPSEERQMFFRTNHLGLPWEPQVGRVRDTEVYALVAGRVEDDGAGNRIKVGEAYLLSYRDGEMCAPLPVMPDVLVVTADKQGDYLKYVVWCWSVSGEAWHVDHGILKDEEDLLALQHRAYMRPDGEMGHIVGGLVDCGFRQQDVFRACLRAQGNGWHLYPCKGFDGLAFRGKMIREREDMIDGSPVLIYDFWSHVFTSNFYLGKVSRREKPRLWLPEDIGEDLVKEWSAEKLVLKTVGGRKVQKWEHERAKDGPNDYGDCAKMQLVAWQVLAPVLGAGETGGDVPAEAEASEV